MKRTFLLLALGFLAFSADADAQAVAVSVNTGARCGVVYAGPGYSVGPVSAGAIYRPSPVACYPVAPVAIYPSTYYYSGYAGYTSGTIYSSGFGTNVSSVVRVDNVGAPVVFTGGVIQADREPRKVQLRTSR